MFCTNRQPIVFDRLDLIDMLSRLPANEQREAQRQYDRKDQKQADALAALAMVERRDEAQPR